MSSRLFASYVFCELQLDSGRFETAAVTLEQDIDGATHGWQICFKGKL